MYLVEISLPGHDDPWQEVSHSWLTDEDPRPALIAQGWEEYEDGPTLRRGNASVQVITQIEKMESVLQGVRAVFNGRHLEKY